MSKHRLKIDALNSGFEKIVLLDETQEEIDVPPVIKTPLGNYLVCYTKLDTVLLTPEIFRSWSLRHGATSYAALDEIVEEVYDVHFCLRFASEIDAVKIGANQAETPDGGDELVTGPAGDAGAGSCVPSPSAGPAGVKGVAEGDVIGVSLHNRTVADAYICIGTTGGLGLENPDQPVLPIVVQKYKDMVEGMHVSCTNLRHFHISDRRNVFYEIEPGPDNPDSPDYRVNLRTVEYPQQPKDPCVTGILPVPSWNSEGSNLFDSKELERLYSRWGEEFLPCRTALTGGDVSWSEYLSHCDKSTDSLTFRFLDGAKTVRPGRLKGDSGLSSPQKDPVWAFEVARRNVYSAH
ncbi:MAG: hypothetical protein [Sclerotinia sclerotiorum narnavirus 1]|nr:MAG: hypothetical protein [Sclerotinia sclerotiorum narnavirus 1]